MPGVSLTTPVGRLWIASDGSALVGVRWVESDDPGEAEEDGVSRETARQLEGYFAGELTSFDVPLRFVGGSAFERQIWEAMRAIPFAETRTYGDLAAQTGGVARAVGGACGRNPIPIVVPCHRVVGAGGRMVGFSGGAGVETKMRLLDLERGQKSLF